MMENIASAALLADEIPLGVIQLDEGYQSSWGDWTERNARFPHQLKWLADRVRGSGFTPGLWLGPLTAHPKSRLASDHPDWLLRNRHGRFVSPGLISGFLGRALDPTHPGVADYLRRLLDTAVSNWGFSYLKLDFMYAGALLGKRYNPRMTRAQAMRKAFQIIRDAAGDDTYLVGCGAPLGPAVGLVDAMRIGADTAPMWGASYGAVGRFMQDNPSLPSLRNSLQNVASRAWIHNRWWTNDPDTLMIRDTQTALTEDEVLAQNTLLGLSGGLLLLSDDLDALPPERRAKAAALFPPLLVGMDVLDLFSHEMPECIVVPVDRPWGRWRLIGLFNWRDEAVRRELPVDVLPHRDKSYHIVDFWAQRYIRLRAGEKRPVLHLPSHGAVLLGIRECKATPQLVATTFHISQGAEITALKVSAEMVTLDIELDRLARGAVWLALPSRPKAAFLNDEPLPATAIHTVSSGIWAIDCRVNRVGTLQVVWDPATAT
jgi:alpha-galactosidase